MKIKTIIGISALVGAAAALTTAAIVMKKKKDEFDFLCEPEDLDDYDDCCCCDPVSDSKNNNGQDLNVEIPAEEYDDAADLGIEPDENINDDDITEV